MMKPFAIPGILLTTLLLLAPLGCATSRPSTPSAQESLAGDVANAMGVAKVHVALLDQLGSDALSVRAEVQGNRATLRGEVKKRSTQELAEEVALSVEGIERVDNRLRLAQDAAGSDGGRIEKVTRDTGDEVRDAALETRVKLKLLGELGRHALGIEVEATDGVVSLRGTVPDKERRSIALRTAQEATGVEKVLDLLKAER